MDKEIKVLEICSGDFQRVGLAVIVWKWYTKFDKEKLQVDYAVTNYDGVDDVYKEVIEKNGGKVYNLISEKNIFIRQYEKLKKLRKISKSNKYDCIHIHCSVATLAFICLLAVRRFCSNILIHSHTTNVDGTSTQKNFKMIIKKAFNIICKSFLIGSNITYLACSNDAAKWLFPIHIYKKHKYTVVKNGIEAEKFIFNNDVRNNIREHLSITDKFVIGNIGRITYQKNHDFLIDVFAEVYKQNSNSVLLIVGSGELEDTIRSKVSALGLDNAVIFYGTTPNVNELYQAMDCFVFPSHFEGLGIVAIEAQTAGLKTLCADTIPEEAKITDLIEFMSLTDTPEKWAERILSYNDGYERRNMLDEIKKNGYDIKQSAAQLEEIYKGNAF